MNERHARPCGQEDLAALLGRLLEPSFADKRLETLDDRVQPSPVGEDVVGEGFRESSSLDEIEVFGHWKVEALIQSAAFASTHVWCNVFVHVRGHGGCGVCAVVPRLE